MPGPQDLMALLGGGAPGGAPGGGGGQMIQQVLQQLMSNPAAIQGMQNYMQGQPPTAGMPQPGGMSPTGMPPPEGGGMPRMEGMPPPGPPPTMPPGGPPPGDMPPEGDPEQMASDQIDQAGNTWDGVDAPTKNDIERLKEDPNEEAVASFDEQFGEGAAEKYLEGDTEGEEPESGEAEEVDASSEDDEEY